MAKEPTPDQPRKKMKASNLFVWIILVLVMIGLGGFGVTNFGGGNTSAKIMQADPLTGEQVAVLWVKGSGGDIGSMKLDGFATLYQDKLEALKGIYQGVHDEDRMVGFLPHCTFNLNPRAASIDTPLHAYIAHRHVDHMHPDACIAIAACKRRQQSDNRN